MRYLLDTNIFIYAAIDRDLLSRDVKAILEDYDNTFFLSSESVKEMIVGFNNGGIVSRFWSTASEMVGGSIFIDPSHEEGTSVVFTVRK